MTQQIYIDTATPEEFVALHTLGAPDPYSDSYLFVEKDGRLAVSYIAPDEEAFISPKGAVQFYFNLPAMLTGSEFADEDTDDNTMSLAQATDLLALAREKWDQPERPVGRID